MPSHTLEIYIETHPSLTARFRMTVMRFPRRLVGASRCLIALMLLIFSAHHAAPDAPVWTGHWGGGIHGEHHAHGASSEDGISFEFDSSNEFRSAQASGLFFAAVHDHTHAHCELCFGSAFNLPVTAVAPPRANLEAASAGLRSRTLQIAGDARLPDAHAPPRA